jgi:hypothetical protein
MTMTMTTAIREWNRAAIPIGRAAAHANMKIGARDRTVLPAQWGHANRGHV